MNSTGIIYGVIEEIVLNGHTHVHGPDSGRGLIIVDGLTWPFYFNARDKDKIEKAINQKIVARCRLQPLAATALSVGYWLFDGYASCAEQLKNYEH